MCEGFFEKEREKQMLILEVFKKKLPENSLIILILTIFN
ncbi:MAG: hypothetical protein RL757_302 [Bacteroidota bacterium]|jgi:hypothetical protein